MGPLIGLLTDEDSYVRRQAAEALGELGSEVAVGPLVELLKDQYKYVRREAVLALVKFSTPKAINSLKFLYKKETQDKLIVAKNRTDAL